MDDKTKKARRIDAELRLKARALRRLAPQIDSPIQPLHPIIVDRAVGKLSRTPTPCSCAMCGSRRKYHKGKERESMAERKARLKEKESPE